MTRRYRPALTAISAGVLLLPTLGAMAGDEDISPNAYQEFDPVTGYMITVDPDAENQQGHTAADAQRADAGDGRLSEPGAHDTWLYLAVAVVAAALFIVWRRGKARSTSPL